MRFKLFGVEIYVSFLFAAVICFMIFTDRTGLCMPTLLCVLLHEAGHLIAMWICESEPKSIKLVPASVSITRGISRKKYGDMFIALAGPLLNIIAAVSVGANYMITHLPISYMFMLINLAVALFNLLPVSGLDGGTVLLVILTKIYKNPQKAEGILKIITLLLGVIVFLLGVFICVKGKLNITVFIVAFYIIISAFLRL